MKSKKTVMERRKFLANIGAVTVGSFLPWERAIGNVTNTPGQSPFPRFPNEHWANQALKYPFLDWEQPLT